MSSTEAMRRYRANPDNREREQRINACRHAALNALADLHREDYERLCNAERRKAGLPLLRERRGRPKKAAATIIQHPAKAKAAKAAKRKSA